MTWLRGPVLHEYLGEEKAHGAPRSRDHYNPCESFTRGRGGFSFGGHRDSSLYRGPSLSDAGLMGRNVNAFSLNTYSPGVRGWKTSARTPDERITR
jgi:hypothetical protein